MTAKELKQRMLKDAFDKRLIVPSEGLIAYDQACAECQERLVFALQVGDETVSIGLSTVLQCLKVAELGKYLPEIDEGIERGGWWLKVKLIIPNLDLPSESL